jgi:hypothetical protein
VPPSEIVRREDSKSERERERERREKKEGTGREMRAVTHASSAIPNSLVDPWYINDREIK